MGQKDPPTIRHRVHQSIRKYAGIHVRGIERQLGVSAPLVQYHLKKLVEAGYVEAKEQSGYTRYYPTAKSQAVTVTDADLPILGTLREAVPLHIALILLDHGPQTNGQLAQRLGLAKSTTSYHLAKLAQVGIVVRAGDSTAIELADAEGVHRILLAHEPTPDLLDAFADLWSDLYG